MIRMPRCRISGGHICHPETGYPLVLHGAHRWEIAGETVGGDLILSNGPNVHVLAPPEAREIIEYARQVERSKALHPSTQAKACQVYAFPVGGR